MIGPVALLQGLLGGKYEGGKGAMAVLAVLLLQKVWRNIDTAGKGNKEGQHGNTILYCVLTKLNYKFILCNFIITTATFTPPLHSLMHTVKAMIGANESSADPTLMETLALLSMDFWQYGREVGLDFYQQSGEEN